jgi:hypothetical protein
MNHKPFKSHKEEADFWESTLRGVKDDDHGWEEVKYKPRATVTPREHVYRIRLDDEEMAGLQALAKQKRQPASTVMRDLIRVEVKRSIAR